VVCSGGKSLHPEGLYIALEGFLVVLDRATVVGLFLLHEVTGDLPLGEQGIPRDHRPFDVHAGQTWFDAGDPVGLGIDVGLADDDPFPVDDGGEQVDLRIARTPKRLAVKGDGFGSGEHAHEPGADGAIESLDIDCLEQALGAFLVKPKRRRLSFERQEAHSAMAM